LKLLEELCAIHSVSGDEKRIKDYILKYIEVQKSNWKVLPEIFHGEDFQNCIVLKFGEPRTAVFAHMDSIGYTVAYENELIKVGGPDTKEKIELEGEDSEGKIETQIISKELDNEKKYFADFSRTIERGTNLAFKANFRINDEFVQSPYLDNRLGVYNALKLCEKLENGLVCFSCWEEHKGGAVAFLSRFIYEKFGVKQALISDITWVTNGVKHGEGVAISMRDSMIPRRVFLNRIIDLAKKSGIQYQLEVESAGGSDGSEIQKSLYPIDWCFIGPPEDHVHSPNEKVSIKDIKSFLDIYSYLMDKL